MGDAAPLSAAHLAVPDYRRISFMTFAKGDPNVCTFLHNILNPRNVNVLGTLVTPHGELDIEQQRPNDVGVKFLSMYFARPGVVNWSDDSVNQAVKRTIEQFTRTDTDFAQIFNVLTTGNPPPPPFDDLTVDECFFAATCRLMHKLEMSDTQHSGPQGLKVVQAGYAVAPTDFRTSTTEAFDLNFFINRVMTLPRSLEQGELMPMEKPMSNEIMMEFMKAFRRETKNRLDLFRGILIRHNITIVLPTTVQLSKLYTLDVNEHSSMLTRETPVRMLPKKTKEKKYEHKLVGFVRCDGLDTTGFINYIRSLLNSQILCYNWTAGDKRGYQDLSTGTYYEKMATDSDVFDDQVKPDINYVSTFWNKLCIMIQVSGITKGTMIQWRIEERMGFPHLVVNIWNLISNKLPIAQTSVGQDLSTVTTFDITDFANTIFKPPVSRVPVILHTVDLTCQVPGGLQKTAWIIRTNPRGDAEFKMADSILSAHVPGTRVSHPRAHLEDLRSQFFHGIESINSSIFDYCRTGNNVVLHSLITSPSTAHRTETSEISVFMSIPAILKHLIDDSSFQQTGESSFNVSVRVKLLLDNPGFAEQNGIPNMHELKRFGVCLCRYLHDMSLRVITSITSEKVLDESAFMAFYNAIFYLGIDVGTFVVSDTGSNALDLEYLRSVRRLQRISRELEKRKAANETHLGDSKGTRREALMRNPHYLRRQSGIQKMEKYITDALVNADERDSATGQNYSRKLHIAVGYDPPEASKPVKLDERKRGPIIYTIRHIKQHCPDLYGQPQAAAAGPAPGGGGKPHKTRRVKRNKSRNFRNKSRVRRTRRRVIKRKNNKK